MRPIDADALMQRIENWDRQLRSFTHYTDRIALDVLCGVVDEIEDLDTLDYEPVRHGEWMDNVDENGFLLNAWRKCSVCGGLNYSKKPSYCPNCGAKMNGGK